MMSINETLTAALTTPTPIKLWQLRGDLLQAGLPPAASTWEVLDKFFEFLNEISAGISAHEYSSLASLLDIGALGGIVLEDLLDSKATTAELWQSLLIGGISESLMVLASRQYIKAAEAEMVGIYYNAAWYIYQELWQLSQQFQPELSPITRRQSIESLLAPIHHEEVKGLIQAVLIGRLFQILLLLHLSMNLQKWEIGD